MLEISNPRDALRKLLEDDEKGVATIYTPGGDQQVSIINESRLYSLVLRSRKPQARAFKRWVTGLLRQLVPPYGGNTITDARLANLFRVRRTSGAAHGWPCTHHFQLMVLPQGVAIMRQLVIQDIERGVL